MTGTAVGRPIANEVSALTRLPGSVRTGIYDIIVAFANADKGTDDDRKRLLRIYSEALLDFHPAVAEAAVAYLKFHNPRNPYRPSPQDVFETAEAVASTWHRRVLGYFLKKEGWGVDRIPASTPSRFLVKLPFGPLPLTSGCEIQHEIVVGHLKEVLATEDGQAFLYKLTLEELDRIPKGCYQPDQYEETKALIGWSDTDPDKQKAFLGAMDPELRRHRAMYIRMSHTRKWTEPQLMRAARQSLAEEKAQKTLKE